VGSLAARRVTESDRAGVWQNDSDSNSNTDTPRTGWTGFRLPFLPSPPIFLPFGHVTGQTGRLCRLEVVVPNHAAGDAAGAGTYPFLVDDEDIRAVALASLLELLREMPTSRQSMDPCPDDQVLGAFW